MTNFPTMGNSAATNWVDVSAQPSVNTKFVPKKNGKNDAPVGTKANRKGVLERNGFKGAPQVNMVYPNCPEAKLEQRNVRLMPTAVGNRDFYQQRAEGPGTSGNTGQRVIPPGAWPVLRKLG